MPPEPHRHTEREVEHKFRVPNTFELPALDDIVPVVEAAGTTVLTAVYYDTADLRLVRDGITLRRRSGGDDAGWHLKLPVSRYSAGTRDEIHVPTASGRSDPPAELVGLVRAIARRAAIGPVSTLRTTRETWILYDSAGEPIGELVDDRVTISDDAGNPTGTFRELELEERPASTPQDINAIADVLAGAGAETGQFTPKVARALGRVALEPPDVPPPAAVRDTDAAWDAIQAYVTAQVGKLRFADVGARRDAADAVHKMRVSARRIRSALRAFRPLLDRDWADALRDELSWMATELGLFRDSEVLLSRLTAYREPRGTPAFKVLRGVLNEQLDDGRNRVTTALNTDRYLDLHDALIEAIREPRTTQIARMPARDVLPDLVDRAWTRLHRRASKVVAAEQNTNRGASDSAWHETRIAAKRARYTVDATVEVFGSDAATLASRLSDVTDILGEHQDASQASTLAADLAASPTARDDGEIAFALGVIHEIERGRVSAARHEFVTTWPSVDTPALTGWSRR